MLTDCGGGVGQQAKCAGKSPETQVVMGKPLSAEQASPAQVGILRPSLFYYFSSQPITHTHVLITHSFSATMGTHQHRQGTSQCPGG